MKQPTHIILLLLLLGGALTLVAQEVSVGLPQVTLGEVTVQGERGKYSKRNNPAVDLMERVRRGREGNDPRRHDRYSYRRYDRFSFGLNDFDAIAPADTAAGAQPGKWDFVRDHIDTSAVTGLPILPLSVKEKVTDVAFTRSPDTHKEMVLGIRQHGVDQIDDLQNSLTLFEDTFREIDIYDDDIAVLKNRFVSPLGRLGADFYRYYITDTVEIDGRHHIELSFTPRNPASFGFSGKMYVAIGYTSMFVRRVLMRVPPSINLNFVDFLQVRQEFVRAPDGSRLKTLDDFDIILALLPGAKGLYVHRATSYANHSFGPLPHPETVQKLGTTFYDPEVYARDDRFWEEQRQLPVSRVEAAMPVFMEQLHDVKAYRVGEKALKLMVIGYVPTGDPSKVDLGPINTLASGNSVEGLRLRLGGMTTAALSPRWFARGYAAYGFKDRKAKYEGQIEYSFRDKELHPREFPVHSLRLTQRYDLDWLGQHYLFTNPDNVFLSLKRQSNTLATYLRQTRLDYMLELPNHLSFSATADARRQEASRYVALRYGDGREIGHYNQLRLSAALRWAPGEKFIQTRSDRLPVNLDAPVFILSHSFAPRRVMGAPFGLNVTELSVQKRFWFSAFGYADVIVRGGHVWGRACWLDLMTPNANLSYTIQPESFALLKPLEFMADSYASWDLTYWANGAIFNYIPLLKRLKWREVFAFRGWWGCLSRRNDPRLWPSELLALPDQAMATPMHGTPYMEISAGIDNLLRFLRLDYVWRLDYRQGLPGKDRSGVRVAAHFTF